MAWKAVITVTFEETNEVTTMVPVMKFLSVEDRDAAISTVMAAGMEASHRLLDAILPELSDR
jgi:hypothetical protein